MDLDIARYYGRDITFARLTDVENGIQDSVGEQHSRRGRKGCAAGAAGGMPMHVEVKQESGHWSVYVDGRRMVDRESFAVADRIREALEHPDRFPSPSEAGEVAQAIRDWVESAR